MVVTVDEGAVISLDELCIVEGIEDEAFYFLVDVLIVVGNAVVGWKANGLVAGCSNGNGANDGVRILGIYLLSYSLLYLFGSYTALFELNYVVTTTSEVDTAWEATCAEETDSDDCTYDEYVDRALAHLHEVDVNVIQEVAWEACSEGQSEPLVLI